MHKLTPLPDSEASVLISEAFDSSDGRDAISAFVARYWEPFFGFEFCGGKLLFSHCGNLLERFAFWLGSFTVQPVFEPFVL